MTLKQDVNVQGPLYLSEQQLALADVLVPDAPHVIDCTECFDSCCSRKRLLPHLSDVNGPKR